MTGNIDSGIIPQDGSGLPPLGSTVQGFTIMILSMIMTRWVIWRDSTATA